MNKKTLTTPFSPPLFRGGEKGLGGIKTL